MSVLKGMRVVEGSAFVAVPLAGMTLAQMGAEVIRFDRLGGGLDAGRWPLAPNGESLFWAGMNKGKKSVAVDMKSPEGRELITRIITAPGDDAGLFLTNLRVRGWMDYDTLCKDRDDLIMVTLTGDRHGRPQVDYTVNPALGIPHLTGPADSDAPVAHALPAWDLIAGNMCVSALLAAERHRLRGHGGQEVEIALQGRGRRHAWAFGDDRRCRFERAGPGQVGECTVWRVWTGFCLCRWTPRNGDRPDRPPMARHLQGDGNHRSDGVAGTAHWRIPC